MKQRGILELVSKSIIEDGLCDALFLKGSLARHEEDDYSDIDLYCVVSPHNQSSFLAKRLDYLLTYQDILYHSEANFVGPQIVAIYEDGTHIDLYMVTIDSIIETDQIHVLYDPKSLLKHYQAQPLVLTDEEVRRLIDGFSFTMFEFYHAYMRGDFVFAFKLANLLHTDYTQMYRYFKQPSFSKLPSKRFIFCLSPEEKERYLYLTKQLKYDGVLGAVKMIVEEMQQLILTLPLAITFNVNYVFFEYGKKKIFQLIEVKK